MIQNAQTFKSSLQATIEMLRSRKLKEHVQAIRKLEEEIRAAQKIKMETLKTTLEANRKRARDIECQERPIEQVKISFLLCENAVEVKRLKTEKMVK